MARPGKIISALLLTSVIAPVILILSVYAGLFGHLQTREELLRYENAKASMVLSLEGSPIGRFYVENRTLITSSQIPDHLRDALIATEDARFLEHSGVDTRSLFRVFFKSILLNDRSSGGGSTITQQLAKNMYGRENKGRHSIIITKIREVLLAYRLEKALTKEEILTLYLNTVPFGENIFGIEEASHRYFAKKTENLKPEESAVLIGMLKANTYYNPHLNPENARKRRNVVLKQMERYGYLAVREADSLCKLPMAQHYSNSDEGGPADYFLVKVKEEAQDILRELNHGTEKKWNLEEDGLTITTTMSLSLQNCANEAFGRHLPVMQERLNRQYSSGSAKRSLGEISDSLRKVLTTLQAGLLAMDPGTGAVRAWVGGINFKTQPYDQISARRQLASVFKPILYATALEEGMVPCQYLDNDSVILSGFEDWSPENYDHSYGGKYSLAGALVKSMNIPTFSLFMNVGFDKVDTIWRRMGFSFPLDNTPSLALGTAEASIGEVATAYSAFANGGYRIIPYTIASVKTSDGEVIWQKESSSPEESVLTERSVMLMNAMLQKAIREGTGASLYSVYNVSVPLAGKTGTSQNYADAWFAAYNPGIVIVTRVGASSPGIHFTSGSYGSGSALALPLVALTLKKAESYPELNDMLYAPFPDLPPELAQLLDCPDFRETNFFDRLKDLFEKDVTIYDPEGKKTVSKVKSLLEKLFKK
jgi:penicillin-binding protein 1A